MKSIVSTGYVRLTALLAVAVPLALIYGGSARWP